MLAAAMHVKFAHLATRSVRYLEAGSGRPLVLLHAFPLSADQWLPQLHRVPKGWRYLAPDLRGFRGAGARYEDAPLHEETMAAYAADVIEFLHHVEATPAVVLGLSMGGYVAMALVGRAPAVVSGLVLANTRAGADSEEGKAGRDRMVALVEREGPAAAAAGLMPKLLGETTRREQPDLAEAVTGLVEQNTAQAITMALRAMKARPDSTLALAGVTCPVTIIHGAEDALIPQAESEAMHRAIPGSRLVVIDGAGHLSNLEAPRAFSEAIESAG